MILATGALVLVMALVVVWVTPSRHVPFTGATIRLYMDLESGRYVPSSQPAAVLRVADPGKVKELAAFFPDMDHTPWRECVAGNWGAGAVIDLTRADGGMVTIHVSVNDDLDVYSSSAAEGDKDVCGDLRAFLCELSKPPPASQPVKAGPAREDPTTTGPATAPAAVDAAKLVEEVRQSEQWVHEAKSFYFRFKSAWINSPQEIAGREAELRKDWPDDEVDANHFPTLRPRIDLVVEMAFDQTRVGQRAAGSSRISFSRWDGKEGLRLWQELPDGRPELALDNSVCFGDVFSPMSHLSWLRAGPHPWWWQSDEIKRQEEQRVPKPSEFVLSGTTRFRGIECYMLEKRRLPAQVWYVGVEDRRLHGIHDFFQPVAMTPRERTEVIGQIASRVGGDFKTEAEMEKWRTSAPPDKRELLDKAKTDCFRPYQRPQLEHWLMEYRQVAPGCWVPMKQGYTWLQYPTRDKPIKDNHEEVEVTEVRVNESLPDGFFSIEIPEGATVADYREKPQISYKYNKNRTADEWLQTRKEAFQQNDLVAAGYRLRDLLTSKPPRFFWLTGYVQGRDFAPARKAAALPDNAIVSEAGEPYSGKRPFKIALGNSKGDPNQPDRVFIDFTGTGKFDPRAAIAVRPAGACKPLDFTGRFGPVELKVQRNGRQYVLSVVGEVLCIDKQYLVGAALLPMLESSCSFGATTHRVRLVDVESFILDRPSRRKFRPNSTLILIDADDRGFAVPLPANVGQRVMVDGEWYEVSVVDGKVQAAPAQVQAAFLSMPGLHWDAKLERGGKSFYVAGGAKPTAIPAGKYSCGWFRIWTADDPQAGTVLVGVSGPKLDLQPGRELNLGSPFPLRGDLQVETMRERTIMFTLRLTAKNGIGSLILKTKGGQADQPAPPTVVVTDESGKVVCRAAMGYG
jgi:hypothetical protein